MTGVLSTVDLNRFQRIIFRVTKGNALTLFADLDIPAPSDGKTMFMLIFSGGQHQQMRHRLLKVCDSFGVVRFDVPRQVGEQHAKLREVEMQLQEQ